MDVSVTPADSTRSPSLSMREQLIAVGNRLADSQRDVVTFAAALDRSGEWTLDGARTCAHWIADALEVEVCTAREWLRIGHSLSTLTVVGKAFNDGRLSYSKVRALTRVATQQNEAELCQIAEGETAARLTYALAAWLTRHESADDTRRRQHEARGLRWWVEPDGMVSGQFKLAPEEAAILIAAVDATVLARARRPRPGTAAVGSDTDASAEAPSTRDVTRTNSMPQQRADALVDLVAGTGDRIEAEILIHVRGDGCSLEDGTPIAGSVVERIAPSSFLRVMLHDACSQPINASGRQRHPTERQRRVVRERDRVCVDCGQTAFLEYDHEPPFEQTHHTLVDELRLRCWHCHHARHGSTPDTAAHTPI